MLIKLLKKYLGLSLLIFFFLVLPLLANYRIPESFEMIKVLAFLGGTNVFLAILSIVLYYRISVKKDRLLVLLAVWWLILGVSSLINGNHGESWFGQYYRYQGLITFFGLIEFVFLVSKVDFEPTQIRKIFNISGVVNSLIIYGQYISLHWLNQPIYNFNGRMTANLGNPDFAGGFLALIAAYVSPTLWPIFFGAIWLTKSRSALIAFALILILKIFGLFKSNKWRIGLATVILIVLGVIFPLRAVSTFENRLVIWQKALTAISQKPILGWGVENFSWAFQSSLLPNDFDLKNIRVDKAHNEFLEITTAGGVLALGLYIMIWLTVVKNQWRGKSDPWRQNNLVCLGAFLILSNLNVMSIAEYIFFYFVAGVSLRKFSYKFRNNEKPE